MSRSKILTPVAFAIVLAATAVTRAATVVEYGLTEANAAKASTLALTVRAEGVGATSLRAVGTSGPLDYSRTLLFSSWPTAGSGLDEAQYLEFTVTPEDGHSVSYATITLSVASGGRGTPRLDVRASTDGFVESVLPLQALRYTANTTTQKLPDLDISTLGTHTGPVTFRIYMEKGDSGFAGILDTDAFGGGTSVIVGGTMN